MERTYCHRCSTVLQKQGERVWSCEQCDQTFYENPRPCVEIAIFNEAGEVLLSERAFEPAKGKYDMPGGFIEYEETAEDAILRELKEELDVDPDNISTPQFVLTYDSTYPWGKETYHLIVMVFMAKTKGKLTFDPQDDVASVQWVEPSKINKDELAYPKLFDFVAQAQKML